MASTLADHAETDEDGPIVGSVGILTALTSVKEEEEEEDALQVDAAVTVPKEMRDAKKNPFFDQPV